MAHYPADTFQEATEIAIESSNQLHGVINGDANAEVTVEDGSKIPSVRKAMVDSLYFKPPIAWAQGEYEDTYNQLREFVDGDVRTWWFAKGATVSTPVLMTTNPATDPNWTLWSAVTLNAATYETQKRLAAEAGLNMVGSFLLGGTVTNVGDVVFYETDGKYYGWGGSLPKVVPAGSTPATSGGIGAGAWIDRTSAALRDDINVVVKRFDNVADMVADSALLVGQLVETTSYYAGWAATNYCAAGGNTYEIVAGGTGAADGGSYINLTNGLQAKATFPNGVSFRKFGAHPDISDTTDDYLPVKSAITYAYKNNAEINEKTESVYYVGSQITLGDVPKQAFKVNGPTPMVSDQTLTGVRNGLVFVGLNSLATKPMFKFYSLAATDYRGIEGIEFNNVRFDCTSGCSGLEFNNTKPTDITYIPKLDEVASWTSNIALNSTCTFFIKNCSFAGVRPTLSSADGYSRLTGRSYTFGLTASRSFSSIIDNCDFDGFDDQVVFYGSDSPLVNRINLRFCLRGISFVKQSNYKVTHFAKNIWNKNCYYYSVFSDCNADISKFNYETTSRNSGGVETTPLFTSEVAASGTALTVTIPANSATATFNADVTGLIKTRCSVVYFVTDTVGNVIPLTFVSTSGSTATLPDTVRLPIGVTSALVSVGIESGVIFSGCSSKLTNSHCNGYRIAVLTHNAQGDIFIDGITSENTLNMQYWRSIEVVDNRFYSVERTIMRKCWIKIGQGINGEIIKQINNHPQTNLCKMTPSPLGGSSDIPCAKSTDESGNYTTFALPSFGIRGGGHIYTPDAPRNLAVTSGVTLKYTVTAKLDPYYTGSDTSLTASLVRSANTAGVNALGTVGTLTTTAQVYVFTAAYAQPFAVFFSANALVFDVKCTLA